MGSSFRLLDWDSSHFGIRIGRVLGNPDERLFRDASSWAEESRLECMYLLLDSDNAKSIRSASKFGWRMVDVRVTLELGITDAVRSDVPMRSATAEDLPYLQQLAIRSHKDSRFYTDGNFPTAACDELFSTWIARSVHDRSFAGVVFVPLVEEHEPGGYITCAIKPGAGEIGLIAVDPKVQKRGLGSSLLAAAVKWCSVQGVKRLSVATQGCNVPALRMYERFGFRITTMQIWFHWWRGSDRA